MQYLTEPRLPRRMQWRLSLLGGWRLERNGRLVAVVPAAQRLLAVVALRGPCQRLPLASLLWPDRSEARALTCLRAGLYRVHRQLPGVLGERRDPISLGPSVEVDVHHLALPWDGAGPSEDLLPGWYDDWVTAERERIRQLWLHTVEQHADALASAGEFGAALDVALSAVRAEPLRESAHRLVVRLHLAEGNVIEAIRAYERYRGLLFAELGIEPTKRFSRLVAGLDGTVGAARPR